MTMLHFTDPSGITDIGSEIVSGPVRKRAGNSYIWALVSGFPEPIRRNRPLLMLQAYIDDSRSDNPSAFVLGELARFV